jgi:hypothetical protein
LGADEIIGDTDIIVDVGGNKGFKSLGQGDGLRREGRPL